MLAENTQHLNSEQVTCVVQQVCEAHSHWLQKIQQPDGMLCKQSNYF